MFTVCVLDMFGKGVYVKLLLCTSIFLCILYLYFLGATVSFEQSIYNVNEDDIVLNPYLLISNPVSERFNIRVFATDGSATGKCQV